MNCSQECSATKRLDHTQAYPSSGNKRDLQRHPATHRSLVAAGHPSRWQACQIYPSFGNTHPHVLWQGPCTPRPSSLLHTGHTRRCSRTGPSVQRRTTCTHHPHARITRLSLMTSSHLPVTDAAFSVPGTLGCYLVLQHECACCSIGLTHSAQESTKFQTRALRM